MKKKYAFGLDAVRVLAVVLVSLTHQVVRTGNYNYQPGIVWVFTMLCFYLSHSCVPLFLLLSGYLCGEKRPQKSYFRGIFRVAVPYLLISVLCVLKLWLWDRDPSMKFTTAIYWILSFRANEYAWYVEMYLGLFLMIPFLNLGYDAIPSRKWKAVLLGILAFLTLLPDVVSSFGTAQVRADILPDYFNACYPVTYYLLGRWIRKNEASLSIRCAVALLGIGWMLPTGLCIFRSVTSGTYAGGTTLNTFGCLTTALCAMGLFLLLIRWKQSAFLQRPIREISKVSFELYLCMGIVDPLLYTWIRRSFLEMTLLSLICAWILCKLVRLVSEPMIRWAGRLYDTVIRVS